MGIKPKIIGSDIGQISPACRLAFDAKYRPPEGAVVMFDLTSMLYRMQSGGRNELMTGDEVKSSFMSKLYNLCRSYGPAANRKVFASAIVVCLDRRHLVPAEKGKTQAKRVARAPVVKYSSEASFTPAGLQIASSGCERIDMSRLAKSGALHAKLAQWLFDAVPDNFDVPVLMDCFDEPRWAGPIRGRKTVGSHQLGEADLALMVWTHAFRERPIVHVTVDGDEVPIALSYMRTHGPPEHGWHWIQHWKPTGDPKANVIDLVRLYDDITVEQPAKRPRSAAPLDFEFRMDDIESCDRIDAFVLYVLMFGTDYATHVHWTQYAKHPQVWEAIRRSWPYVSNMLRLWKEDSEDWLEPSMRVMDYVTRQILHIFSKKVCPPGIDLDGVENERAPPSLQMLQSLERLRSPNCPKMPLNPEEAVRELRFNFKYWSVRRLNDNSPQNEIEIV